METFYHVTIASNVGRGYDKYSRVYDKANIGESRYPNHFFLLKKDELSIGLEKANHLLSKLGYQDDYAVVLETSVEKALINDVTGTGIGHYVDGSKIGVVRMHILDQNGELSEVSVEEVIADSYSILHQEGILCGYDEVLPRSVSYLPIAIGCQAACDFCFSKTSISSEQAQKRIPFETIEPYFIEAKKQGANRAVITGGGEPTLLKESDMLTCIRQIKEHFDKIVLITNGYEYAKKSEEKRLSSLKALEEAGLSVLSVSRHAASEEKNEGIMHLQTGTEKIMETFQKNEFHSLSLRLISVLQKGGVEDQSSLIEYLDFASEYSVSQICFKELYVSASKESVYYEKHGNLFSRLNQVPLSLVINFCESHGFTKVSELPWGSPVYKGMWNGQELEIACYTEPSLYWEKVNKLARSWNIMSDGTCYASLEDIKSVVTL